MLTLQLGLILSKQKELAKAVYFSSLLFVTCGVNVIFTDVMFFKCALYGQKIVDNYHAHMCFFSIPLEI